MTALDFGRFEVLTFDCYGTLIDWETGIARALRVALGEHARDVHDEDLLTSFAKHEAAAEAGVPLTRIGAVTSASGLEVRDEQGHALRELRHKLALHLRRQIDPLEHEVDSRALRDRRRVLRPRGLATHRRQQRPALAGDEGRQLEVGDVGIEQPEREPTHEDDRDLAPAECASRTLAQGAGAEEGGHRFRPRVRGGRRRRCCRYVG